MTKPEIIRVWGVADNFDLSFEKGQDGGWKSAVPPDLTDGQYATEIFAENEYGETAIWSGILYMHHGKVCLHLVQNKYTVWILPQKSLSLLEEGLKRIKGLDYAMILPRFETGITNLCLRFEGVCCHY